MSESESGVRQVKVKFFTRDTDESLQCSSNPIYVPVSLKRFGLSEIVNHLVNTTTPIPFDFLIDGTLLKSTIEEYLVANALSSETFLNLEYTRAILPPKFLSSFNNEDWISSIDTIGSMTVPGPQSELNLKPKILTGSYDGIVRIYNCQGIVETQLIGHSQPIKSVKFISPTRFISAGMDRSIRLWKSGTISDENEIDSTQDGKTTAILEYHKDLISSLDVNLSTNRILSGSHDNSIALWSTNSKEMQTLKLEEKLNTSTASKKRLKLSLKDSTIKRKSPLSILESHKGPVEGIIFDKLDSTVAYSASQDHCIKTWDLITSRCIDTKQTNYSLLSLTQLPNIGLIATGSSARHINLHDPRSNKVTNNQLIGHTNFVSSLCTSDNDYMLISASHDNTVKIWDVRANKSLYTITRNSGVKKGKVLSVAWEKEIGIISGGDDKKLQINSSADLK
ncbi:hypothetical protein CANARDRAFT_223486 [[Candida] arabinofermentans NRRL YB-2248]|uniref:Ribosome biogenesis protein YTM1 n=1 Tax=[Candida] arabinofermentans NRRL YB-2248 TaxID=983967 RepID=A0A1E4SYL2_9ASCO|nr:hypothetical protein CANARDRAFT_223486 [[Candida] arabinofermentans NRRL YB-2248]